MTTRDRTRRRRVTGFALVAASAVLGLASAAWACGTSMGWIKVSSPTTGTFSYADFAGQTSSGQGARGSTIKVTGGQLKPKPAKYSLMFTRPGSGLDCHTATEMLKSPAGAVLKKMTTNGKGLLDRDLVAAAAQPYKAVIPSDSPTGTANICGREFYPVPDNTYTGHATFTVT